jgi:hypothetical protein
VERTAAIGVPEAAEQEMRKLEQYVVLPGPNGIS